MPLPAFIPDWKRTGSLSTVAKRPHKAWAVWPWKGWRERKQHRIWWSIFWQGVKKDLDVFPDSYALSVETLRLQMQVNTEWFVEFFADAGRRWYLNGAAQRELFNGLRGRGENTAAHFIEALGWEALPKMMIDAQLDLERFNREVRVTRAIVRTVATIAVSAVAGDIVKKIIADAAKKKAEEAAAAGASAADVEEAAMTAVEATPAVSRTVTEALTPEVARRVVETVASQEQLGEAEGRAEDAANLKATTIPKVFFPLSTWNRFKRILSAIFGWAP